MDVNVRAVGRRRGTTLDLAAQAVTINGMLGSRRYTTVGMPEQVRGFLALTGLKEVLLLGDDPDVTYNNLRGGIMPEQRQSGGPPKLSQHREAIAQTFALYKATQAVKAAADKGGKKQSVNAVMAAKLPEAQRLARQLTAEEVRAAFRNEAVQDRYHQMYGHRTADNQMSILALVALLAPNSDSLLPSSPDDPETEPTPPWDDEPGPDA
jgi:anti-anti-sigma regulatory factor